MFSPSSNHPPSEGFGNDSFIICETRIIYLIEEYSLQMQYKDDSFYYMNGNKLTFEKYENAWLNCIESCLADVLIDYTIDDISEQTAHIHDNPGNIHQTKPCVLCIGGFHKDESFQLKPCKHTFHLKCIMPWLEKNNTCPSCRELVQNNPVRSIIIDNDDDDDDDAD